MCFFCFKGNFTPNQLEKCRNLVSPAGSAMQAVQCKQHFAAGRHVSTLLQPRALLVVALSLALLLGSCRAVYMLPTKGQAAASWETMGLCVLTCLAVPSLTLHCPQIIDLTMELSDERHRGDVACQVLDGERAERLRGTRELQELQVGEPGQSLTMPECPSSRVICSLLPFLPQSKHDEVQKKLESVQKQLEEAQQLVQLREMKISGSEGGRAALWTQCMLQVSSQWVPCATLLPWPLATPLHS